MHLLKILPDKGKISRNEAVNKAESEYDIFNKTQRIESDFDREIKRISDIINTNNDSD
ncbi:MAG: hypothetical protein II567_06165 [Candidatus Riflebacteria bacterium]|nr:hypothetical protein [Candidatus Riflebacteria bacterium]